jgi:hypothetical protein
LDGSQRATVPAEVHQATRTAQGRVGLRETGARADAQSAIPFLIEPRF